MMTTIVVGASLLARVFRFVVERRLTDGFEVAA